MIVVLGATGYIGQAFQHELLARGETVVSLSRKEVDYTRYDILVAFLRDRRPDFLVNAAGYTGRPNVDACETAKADTLQGNSLFPLTVSHACRAVDIPWGHVSSGCIFNGMKVQDDNTCHIEPDMMKEGIFELVDGHSPVVRGFDESDVPNFSFRQPPCSFYSGTKALAEESLLEDDRCYLWRLRIPFDECDNPRNYITKLQRYAKVYNNFNSLSHRGDMARACLDLHAIRAPFGIYNVTNPGYVSTRQVVEMIHKTISRNRHFDFWANDAEFYKVAAKTVRSNCILDVSKLLSTGVHLRPVEDALQEALERWCWEPQWTRTAAQHDETRKRSLTSR